MIRDYYVTPKSSKIMRFFWRIAGGDRYLLEKATYSDQIKYMCLGGIVLATGAMAALAGGYAFYTIFEPKGNVLDNYHDVKSLTSNTRAYLEHTDIPTAIMSIVFGLIWGLIIFNIDRFIVTSTGKGDGTEAITLDELKTAIPRIIMGMIIAITISKPVEIRMFKSEIDTKLYETQLKTEKEYEIRTKANFEERLKNVEGDLGKLESQRNDLIERIKRAEKEYSDQLMGRGDARSGDGPLSKALKSQMDALSNELSAFDFKNQQKLQEVQLKRNTVIAEEEAALKNNSKVASGLDGLLERIKLAHEIAGWVISLFITLLFMAIELTPIFFKLMLIKTPYDYMDENVKELIKAENGIEVRYNFYEDKHGQERHLVINHEAERLVYEKIKATDAQKQLIDYAINKYIESQKRLIDENPEKFIKHIGDENSDVVLN